VVFVYEMHVTVTNVSPREYLTWLPLSAPLQ
jgi:hypothetical protein